MNKPHKHAALIKAWADGAEIEMLASGGAWLIRESPSWSLGIEYRIHDPYRELKEAHAAGKVIEFQPAFNDDTWAECSCAEAPLESLPVSRYRIKPEKVAFRWAEDIPDRGTKHKLAA